jgi:hypothetical protein
MRSKAVFALACVAIACALGNLSGDPTQREAWLDIFLVAVCAIVLYVNRSQRGRRPARGTRAYKRSTCLGRRH